MVADSTDMLGARGHRYSKDRSRLGDTLEVIKFICKDFWQAVFKKQVDNLKTNHRVRPSAAAVIGAASKAAATRAARIEGITGTAAMWTGE